MKNKREHAERNADLAQELYKGGKYYDWVITSAFYSAIHYVESAILPCKVNGSTCKNINDVKKAYNQAGRHSARERSVFDKMLEIGPSYRWLDDGSRNSRYTSYKVSKSVAEKALYHLEKVRQACSKGKA